MASNKFFVVVKDTEAVISGVAVDVIDRQESVDSAMLLFREMASSNARYWSPCPLLSTSCFDGLVTRLGWRLSDSAARDMLSRGLGDDRIEYTEYG